MTSATEISFWDKHEMGSFMKRGSFGDFYQCTKKSTEEGFLVKVKSVSNFTEAGLNYSDLEQSREHAIWRRIRHRNIISLEGVYLTPTFHYLRTEPISVNLVGDFLDGIEQMTTYTERDFFHFARQILTALCYLKNKRVIHRNISSNSLMLENNDVVKICDFALAVRHEHGKNNVTVDSVGVPLFLPPEAILEKPVTCATDAWSVGVVFFIMAGGTPPFLRERRETLYAEILTADVTRKLNVVCGENISEVAKSAVCALLEKNDKHRISVNEALERMKNTTQMLSKLHLNKTVSRLKQFNKNRRLNGDIFRVQRVYEKPDDEKSTTANKNQRRLSQSIEKSSKENRRRKSLIVGNTEHFALGNETSVSKLNVQFNPINISIDLNEGDL